MNVTQIAKSETGLHDSGSSCHEMVSLIVGFDSLGSGNVAKAVVSTETPTLVDGS